jgi:biopolymer transport protein ExbD
MKRRGAFGRGPGSSDEGDVDMAPLIDMVFLLLIFYIVTTSFLKESGVEVNRPESNQTTAVHGRFVPVAITADNQVFIAGATIGRAQDRAAIERVVAEQLQAQGTAVAIVQADRAVPTGDLLTVMDACKAAGADRVDVSAVQP